MKRLRFEHQGHLLIKLITLRVLKLWNPFVCSLLTSNPLRHSLLGGGLHFGHCGLTKQGVSINLIENVQKY